ncbi:hypothetical protein BDK51DRAFT_39822 [Blyttiomyces helicus]|uniref:Uncharacterized protein n=1 Tax=Blyttiomyces helicus TaxID=388810 RepID=A0A4P9WAH2_9FUNG|nr:hypothetical protein BDK51DRAFT_39822 [Blyttiomyces helicus]|eukprot:RKO89212.1 hypothetical protein BDK51DRAFT_39822 [Blyttiomyces helicus]
MGDPLSPVILRTVPRRGAAAAPITGPKACAVEIASRGADVITYSSEKSRVEAAAPAAVAEFQKLGVRALHVQSDAGSVDTGNKLLEKIKREFGKIDVIVNNAGGASSPIFSAAPASPLERTNSSQTSSYLHHAVYSQSIHVESEYDRIFAINTKGVFFFVTSALDLGLLQDHGRIINITSVESRSGTPNGGVYAASKAALEAISRSWASELGSRNITANCVAPGPVVTAMLESGHSGEAGKAIKDWMVATTPLGRLDQVADIANVGDG